MIKRKVLILLFLLPLLFGTYAVAQGSYSGYVGSRILLACPTPPGNSAISQTAWGASGAHLKVEKYMNTGCYVTITGYFTGMEQVQCDYYWYWYDNYGAMHTNHATTYYTFTCNAVTVTPSSTYLELDVGEGATLSYTYSPSNISPKPVIAMQSQNTNIATVNNGYVRAVAPGTTYIKFTNNAGPEATCKVVVRNVTPTGVSLPSSLQAYVGESTTLTPTVYPSNANTTFTWYSRNSSIARVSSSGSVTGVEEGETYIYAVSSNGLQTNDCRVSVAYRPPSSVSLNTSSYNLPISQSYTLRATVSPSNARYTLSWSSSNEKVASVSQAGEVTAHKEGTATITVRTDNGRSAVCTVTVPPDPSSVSLPSKVALTWGKTRKLKYSFTPSNAYVRLSWSSTNPAVVQVDQNGMLTACGVGTAEVTARTQNGREASCRVEVDAPVYAFTAWMRASEAVTIGLEEHPKVSFVDGILLMETATRRIEMDTAQVYKFTLDNNTVDRMPGQIVMDSYLELPFKGTKQLKAELLPSDYDIVTTLTWQSSDNSIATVSSSGWVRAIAPGEADISVTASNGCTAVCHVSIPEPAYHLFLWLTDGRYDGYAFTDKPSVSYADGNVLITSTTGVYSYPHEQVQKLTLSDNETPMETAINPIYDQPAQPDMNQLSPDEVRMQGMQPGEKLRVYSVGGKLLQVLTASGQGSLSVPLRQLPPGSYILKTSTITYKIIKK